MEKNIHTTYELRILQALPIDVKIQKTRLRIREWISEFGEDSVYVSFSGGKDSTVLLDIVRKDYPNVPAVFVNTGLEYPSVRKFALSKENVTELRPRMNFRQVVAKYGYPIIGKRQARYIHDLQTAGEHNQNTVHLRLTGLNQEGHYCPTMQLPKKYLFLSDAPFFISEECCNVMKKKPMKELEKDKYPIIATMATESSLREKKWKQYGCNAFALKKPQSNPLSFWTDQDVLRYIYENHLDISDAYGQVVVKGTEDSQSCINDTLDGYRDCKFDTTGCKRTGCIFCGFGITQDKDRFIKLSEQEPALCDYVMRGGAFDKFDGMWKPTNEGMGYWFVLEWLNVHGNLGIGIPNREHYLKEHQTEQTRKFLEVCKMDDYEWDVLDTLEDQCLDDG